MGGYFSRWRATTTTPSVFDLDVLDTDTPPMVELDGEGPVCVAANEHADACSGFMVSADQLRLLIGPNASVSPGHGDWWIAHVCHASICVGDDAEYTRAAVDGLRQWYRDVQRRRQPSRYPF